VPERQTGSSVTLSFLDQPGQLAPRPASGYRLAVLNDLEPLASSSAAYGFIVVLGLLWGSFANVCIYRWPPTDEFPDGRSVVRPGSHCFACKAPVRWYDNVPLVSWLWLR